MRLETKKYAVLVLYKNGVWDFALTSPVFETWTEAYDYQTKIWAEYSSVNPEWWTRDRFAVVRLSGVDFVEVIRGRKKNTLLTPPAASN